jgi:hypothetical protein
MRERISCRIIPTKHKGKGKWWKKHEALDSERSNS